MYFFSFPTGKPPEDTSGSLILIARFLLFFSVGSLIWGLLKVPGWVETLPYQETTGVMKQSDKHGSVFPQYEYQVNGKTYRGELSYAFGDQPLGHYPRTGPVKVFYAPRNPEFSVLHRTPSANLLTGLFGSVIVFYCAIFVWKMAL